MAKDKDEQKPEEVVEEKIEITKTEEVKPTAQIRRKTAVQSATEEIRNEMLYDVVIPKGRDFLFDIGDGLLDIFRNILSTAIFGEERQKPRNLRTDRHGRVYQDYSSITYRERRGRERPPWEGGRSRNARTSIEFDDVYFKRKQDAIEVLDDLIQDTMEYGMVSVDAFYTHPKVGIDTHNFNDRRWGWDDLSKAAVIRIEDGWMLDLPRPVRLDLE